MTAVEEDDVKWRRTRSRIQYKKIMAKEIVFLVIFSTIPEKLQILIFCPKFLTIWKSFLTWNCGFIMRTHPRLYYVTKRNYLNTVSQGGVAYPVEIKFMALHFKSFEKNQPKLHIPYENPPNISLYDKDPPPLFRYCQLHGAAIIFNVFLFY